MLNTIVTIMVFAWFAFVVIAFLIRIIVWLIFKPLIGKTIKVEGRITYRFTVQNIGISRDGLRIALYPNIGHPFELSVFDANFLMKYSAIYPKNRGMVRIEHTLEGGKFSGI